MMRRLFAVLALAGGLASATTIKVWADGSRGEYNLWINENGVDVQTYFTGVLSMTLTDNNGVSYSRDTLCVDLFTNINVNTLYGTTLLRPDQVPGRNLERVSWLVDNALLPTQGIVLSTALPVEDRVTSPEQGAGIQLAIWDIVEDGGNGLDVGTVQAGSLAHPTEQSALDWAIFYERASLDQSSDLAFIYNPFSLDSHTRAQMLAGPEFSDGPHPNPEPATFTLVGAAMIAVGYLARRRRRAHRGAE